MEKPKYSKATLQYLPFFYVIWSDDLLSASETNVVKTAILKDKSLSQKDIKILNSWLNKEQPPKNEEFKSWKTLIDSSKIQLIENDSFPLTLFSQKIGNLYYDNCPVNESLKHIETNLGLQPNHYNHLFSTLRDKPFNSKEYDSKIIDSLLKGKQTKAVNNFREELSSPIFKRSLSRDKSIHRKKVLEQVSFLGERGYGAMAYPKEYGGKNDMEGYAAIFENMMYVDGSMAIKFGVQFGLFGGSIQKLGTEIHHKKYLEKTGKAELLGCFAMTETGHGSNVRGIKTTATYDKVLDQIIIHTPGDLDNKEYIGNALDSKMASVFAQLIVNGKNEGVHAILVPLRDENHKLLSGIKIEDNGYKLGLNGVDNGKIWFNQVAVPKENLLNKYGSIDSKGNYFSNIKNPNKRFFTMLGTLVGGRICVARAGLGGAKKALTIAIKHALQRRQFNDNKKAQEDLLMDYPTHQLRLIPLVASAYVYHITLDDMMNQYCDDTVLDKRKVETQAAGLKSVITWYANNAIQECREACGGKGYLQENTIGDLKNDVDIFTTFEGDNNVLLLLAAKGVLSEFKTEFNSAGFTSVLKLLSMQINDKITSINPIYTNKVDTAHLYDSHFHIHALEYRTRRLTYSVAMRIRDYIKKGMPSYQAFLKVQTHLLALGKAYSTAFAYKKFHTFNSQIKDDKYAKLLNKIGTLYALQEIRQDASWYLEQGYISGTKSKAIRQRVERLCTELRPHINVLIDGFGVPEHCVNAPIARKI
ncbi:acyl-CoA dehydrogenase [uncultured Maribacter sp.]|uniref:acyl-CoA dehydrogenase family protein n=1 Tax=uncultured Maribacter sp. TaxID=431308 RepID=UPI0026110497|nr:acyl-CoA dehydrogenase [uncultured Maribacter sp.]